MGNSLIVADAGNHSVPKNSRLAKSERELAEAIASAFESFYQQGVILERIRADKEFNDAGYDKFETYCDEQNPCGIKANMAYRLIRAMKVRPLLPSFDPGSNGIWTEKSMRPLLHKDFTPADQKRLGKKIATLVKKGEPLTESLVKKVCDEDRGVEKAKFKKKSAEIAATKTAAQTIDGMTIEVNLWLKSLGMVPSEFWEEAEDDEPGCVKELISALSEFADFLRG